MAEKEVRNENEKMAIQVQAFINYIELTTARLESMDDYESWIEFQEIMEYESDSE